MALMMMAQAQSARCAELGGSREELMATIERPTTTIEVLRNFKFALDNDLFLRDEFYTDENLEKFFAASKISWDEVHPLRRIGRVSSLHLDIFLFHGTVDAEGNEAVNGRKQGAGVINASLTADSVIEVFGKPMKVTNPYAAESTTHPSALMPKTHELGNLAIEYKFDRPRTTASLFCIFHGDGTVNRCNFGNTEK